MPIETKPSPGQDRPLSALLNDLVVTFGCRSWPDGFDLSSTDAPNTFRALKAEFDIRGRITVNSANSDHTIYADPEINFMSRAWHDWAHLTLDAGFDVEGEAAACELQCQQIVDLIGMGRAADPCRILRAEIVGQSIYYHRHRRYVVRQRDFVVAYLSDPAAALASVY